jgi:N-acetyl-anhydromuramyl-L-alanine amidase AmpD
MSADHPGLPFVQASGYTKGRPDGPPLWIVVHDMEAHETPTTAENTAQYFATGAGGRSVSSHYCVDNNSVVQCVNLSDVAWTVGNRPGNNRGINWELSGFASQSREQWLDAFGRAMFAQMAPIVQSDSKRFGIPLRRLTVAELRQYLPGITSHNDLREAFGVTDHTDPGPNFPWPEFIATMNGGTDVAQYWFARDDKTLQLYKCDGMNSQPIAQADMADINHLANKEGLFTLVQRTGVGWVTVAGFQVRTGWGPAAYGVLRTTSSGGSVTGPVDLTDAALARVGDEAYKAAQRAENS